MQSVEYENTVFYLSPLGPTYDEYPYDPDGPEDHPLAASDWPDFEHKWPSNRKRLGTTDILKSKGAIGVVELQVRNIITNYEFLE